jgi:hypothetical protein
MRSDASIRMSMPDARAGIRKARHGPQRRERSVGGHRRAAFRPRRESSTVRSIASSACRTLQTVAHQRRSVRARRSAARTVGVDLSFKLGDLPADHDWVRLSSLAASVKDRCRAAASKPRSADSAIGRRRRGWRGGGACMPALYMRFVHA